MLALPLSEGGDGARDGLVLTPVPTKRGGFDAQGGGLEALGGRHHVFWLLVRGARTANAAGNKTRSEE